MPRLDSGFRSNFFQVQQNGDDIFFQTFTGYLTGYDLELNVDSITFGYAGEVKSLLISNKGLTSVTFNNLGLSNSVFDSTTSCGPTLAPGDSCNFSVSGTTPGDASILISASNASQTISRDIPVTLGAIAASIVFDPNCLDIRQHVVISGATCEGAVVVPEGVTSIAHDAFDANNNIYTLTLPSSLRSIGENAFFGDTNLKTVDFGYGIQNIGTAAFYGNTALENVSLPNSLKTIGNQAFESGSSIRSVDFGSSVQSIGDYAFFGATSLTTVSLPNSVKSIGSKAFFSNSRLRALDLGSGVQLIGDSAFANDGDLSSVSLPNSLKTLSDSAFSGASNLTDVDFGSGVQLIGDRAFYQTKVASVLLPNSVRTIGNQAFGFISELRTVQLGSAVSTLSSDAFEGSSAIVTYDYCGSVPSVLATMVTTGASRTTLTCSQGPQGEQGPQGSPGQQGSQGPQGAEGPAATVPVAPDANQTLKAIAAKLKTTKSLALPTTTIQGSRIVWSSTTPKLCTIAKGKVVAKKAKGTCSIKASAPAKTGFKVLVKTIKITIN